MNMKKKNKSLVSMRINLILQKIEKLKKYSKRYIKVQIYNIINYFKILIHLLNMRVYKYIILIRNIIKIN